MELVGSCHCGKVKFSVMSHTPCPFMRCYCSICRKTDGGGGYAINVMGVMDTFKILQGKSNLREYRAIRDKATGELCGNIRYFCGDCGSHLYAWSDEWPENVYPLASAIDTPLPRVNPKDIYHIMLNDESVASWVHAPAPDNNHAFKEYPDVSIEGWHKNNNKFIE
ncbi:Mss4-like protein [Dichotomocladium elegans]|nr:Mss4-like protein [Dichotomocladium elegans]